MGRKSRRFRRNSRRKSRRRRRQWGGATMDAAGTDADAAPPAEEKKDEVVVDPAAGPTAKSVDERWKRMKEFTPGAADAAPPAEEKKNRELKNFGAENDEGKAGAIKALDGGFKKDGSLFGVGLGIIEEKDDVWTRAYADSRGSALGNNYKDEVTQFEGVTMFREAAKKILGEYELKMENRKVRTELKKKGKRRYVYVAGKDGTQVAEPIREKDSDLFKPVHVWSIPKEALYTYPAADEAFRDVMVHQMFTPKGREEAGDDGEISDARLADAMAQRINAEKTGITKGCGR